MFALRQKYREKIEQKRQIENLIDTKASSQKTLPIGPQIYNTQGRQAESRQNNNKRRELYESAGQPDSTKIFQGINYEIVARDPTEWSTKESGLALKYKTIFKFDSECT